MNSRDYSQVYATRPLPENEQRRIRGFGAVLFGLEVLFVIWCLVVKAFLMPEWAAMSVVYGLAFVIAVLFIVTGVMLYQAYYTFWCTPFPLGIPLRLGLVFGGVACAWIFNFVVLIFLIVLFAVIIPQQKLQREVAVRSANGAVGPQATEGVVGTHAESGAVGVRSEGAAAQTGRVVRVEDEPGVTSEAWSVNGAVLGSVQPINEVVSGQAQTAGRAVNVGANGSYVAQNAGGGYGLPVTLAVFSVLNILWSGQFATGMASSLSSSYSSARGMAAVFGWILLLPGVVMGIVFFFVARARVKLMRKYGASKSGVAVAYIILEVLAAVSTLPFVIFWICAAFALGK